MRTHEIEALGEQVMASLVAGLDAMSPLERAAVRLILDGTSAVDWLHFPMDGHDSVRRLLALNEFDLNDPDDRGQLADLYREAVLYLTEVHGYQLPPDIQHGDDVGKLFEWSAAREGVAPEMRTLSCMVLKVVHVLQYLTARELLFHLPISEEELTRRLSAKVFRVIERMRLSDVRMVEFSSGQKSRTSMLTKLLTRRETQAYHVFDRMRCRVVVEERADLLPAIRFLLNNLFPFNYVVPGESANALIPPAILQPTAWGKAPERDSSLPRANEFSGPTYRSINFIAMVPLRVDDLLAQLPSPPDESLGRVIFAQTEFQLLDRATAAQNEAGDNSHEAYKQRQLQRVRERLEVSLDPAGPHLERVEPEE